MMARCSALLMRYFSATSAARSICAKNGPSPRKTAAGLVAAGAVCVTVIADREGDIYEEFACRPAETELLIRAHHDRVLEDGGTLNGCMEEVPELVNLVGSSPAMTMFMEVRFTASPRA